MAQRLRRLSELLARELELISIGTKIQSQVESEIEKGQREFFLRQQLKAIQEELGEVDEQAGRGPGAARADRGRGPARARAQAGRARAAALRAAAPAVRRARRDPQPTSSGSPTLPWSKSTDDHLDLEEARQVLDRDHYDIEKVKDRILEFLAVRKLKPDARSSILCFVGPARRGQDLARASRSPRPWAASSSASRSAACATSPRSAATAAPTSARCPGTIMRAMRDAGLDQPGADDRRDRQDGRGLPRRPVQRDARGARPRAELELPRPLPGPAVRPLAGPVHHHRQPARPDPGAAARPDGDDRARRLHRGGEARDRQALPGAAPDRAERARAVEDRVHRRRRCAR